MTIEAFVISKLSEALPVPVSSDVPNPVPETFVTVEKVGGHVTDHVWTASFALQSWAGSTAEAAELNEAVIAAMEGLLQYDEIGGVDLDTTYNFTDTSTKHARYQALFDIYYVTLG